MKRTAWFSLALVATLLILGSAFSVSADHRYRYSEREVREIGRRTGYELGLHEGRRDHRYGFRFDYKHSRAYKDGKIGYRSEYRHDGNYKKGFREGFEAGYRDGYYGRRGDYWPPHRDGRDDDDGRGRGDRDRPRFPRY
jgi:flagellar biosynthesis/type III secretory pathway protein FliH